MTGMSPLFRYYGSFVVIALIALTIEIISPGNGRIAAIVVLLAMGAYMVFVRCPQCRTRLSAMGDNPGIHGLPGRRCPKCGADLTSA